MAEIEKHSKWVDEGKLSFSPRKRTQKEFKEFPKSWSKAEVLDRGMRKGQISAWEIRPEESEGPTGQTEGGKAEKACEAKQSLVEEQIKVLEDYEQSTKELKRKLTEERDLRRDWN